MRTVSVSALVLVGLLCAASSNASNTHSWTTLDYPSASNTYLYGIDGSNLVGWYTDGANDYGFHYDGSSWTSLSYPLGLDTHLHGIDGDNVVGSYEDSSGNRHGVRYNLQNQQWTTLDQPVNSLPQTDLYSIDDQNIVGYYTDSSNVQHGSLYDGTVWHTYDHPSATRTFFHGVDGPLLVGSYFIAGDENGVIFDRDAPVGSQWTDLNHPTASTTFLYEIDGPSIVGTYRENGVSHGFFYEMFSGSGWETLDYPGAVGTFVHGLDNNSAVGFYRNSSGGFQGFQVTLASVPEPAALLMALSGLALLPRRRRR